MLQAKQLHAIDPVDPDRHVQADRRGVALAVDLQPPRIAVLEPASPSRGSRPPWRTLTMRAGAVARAMSSVDRRQRGAGLGREERFVVVDHRLRGAERGHASVASARAREQNSET